MEPGESENLNCASLILKKRAYISVISDYKKYLSIIGITLNELLKQAGLDPAGIA